MAYKVLKPNTKAYNHYINAYLASSITCLEDCYSKFSYRKERAYYAICEEMQLYNGHDMRILFYNSFFFTIGYIVDDELLIETASSTYILPL